MEIADFRQLDPMIRLGIIIGGVVVAHIAVVAIRAISRRILIVKFDRRLSKARTVTTLVSSVAVFVLYFGAVGVALNELGISVTAYVASASIIGLAVAFGSQGIVQDVVMGVTIIFSDLFDVGDMVEIGGQTGIVRRLGMRFTVLVNSFGSEVYIPNRSIANVTKYARGYIRCIADITLSSDDNLAEKMEGRIRQIVEGFGEQFPGILITSPEYEGRKTSRSGRRFLRVKFRIWPGRGGAIENEFRKETLDALKKLEESYAEWMIAVNYEVEHRPLR
ncbi:MAG: small-conductance mechanosensitive channel [Paracoccaceae bacterium]|jgi:small-conductance mechanosensitive channel